MKLDFEKSLITIIDFEKKDIIVTSGAIETDGEDLEDFDGQS